MTSSPKPSFDSALLFHRALGSLRRTLESLADEVRPVASGWVVRTDSLPLVWTLNQLRMSGAAAAADVLALSEANQPHVPFRHVVAEGDAGSRPLEDPFRAAGWTVDKELVMALTEGPDREVDTRAVIDLSDEQMLALMRRWLIEERPGTSADRLDQVEEYNRREGRLWRERRLGLLDSGGAPAAVTKLRSDGTTAWVEDVYTVPEARGRGYARVLVGHAAELARSSGHELTFIIADDNDWPKHLYARIGFRPIGLIRTFHRDGEVTS